MEILDPTDVPRSSSGSNLTTSERNLIDREDLLSKTAKLHRKVEGLEVNKRDEVSNISKVEEGYSICESAGHSFSECPNIAALKEVYYVRVNAFHQMRE